MATGLDHGSNGKFLEKLDQNGHWSNCRALIEILWPVYIAAIVVAIIMIMLAFIR